MVNNLKRLALRYLIKKISCENEDFWLWTGKTMRSTKENLGLTTAHCKQLTKSRRCPSSFSCTTNCCSQVNTGWAFQYRLPHKREGRIGQLNSFSSHKFWRTRHTVRSSPLPSSWSRGRLTAIVMNRGIEEVTATFPLSLNQSTSAHECQKRGRHLSEPLSLIKISFFSSI